MKSIIELRHKINMRMYGNSMTGTSHLYEFLLFGENSIEKEIKMDLRLPDVYDAYRPFIPLIRNGMDLIENLLRHMEKLGDSYFNYY